MLEASIIRGDSLSTITCRNIKGSAGLITLQGQICTETSIINANVLVDTNAVFYNKSYVDAVVTSTSTDVKGKAGSGPGYAAYGEGTLTLNGLLLPVCR